MLKKLFSKISPTSADKKAKKDKKEAKRDTKAKKKQEKMSKNDDKRSVDAKKKAQQYLLPPMRPEDEGKMCLVLDMDETLLHCSFVEKGVDKYRQTAGEDRRTDETCKPDFHFEVSCFDVEVRCRPGLDRFLTECAKKFEMVVFTASLEEYANKAMDLIDPKGLVQYRLYRPATVTYKGVDYVKDLSRLGRDLRRTVLIDNNHLAMLASPSNSIAINDFFGDPKDTELNEALILVNEIADMTDVRPFLRKTFQMQEQIDDILYQLQTNEFYDEEYYDDAQEEDYEQQQQQQQLEQDKQQAEKDLLALTLADESKAEDSGDEYVDQNPITPQGARASQGFIKEHQARASAVSGPASLSERVGLTQATRASLVARASQIIVDELSPDKNTFQTPPRMSRTIVGSKRDSKNNLAQLSSHMAAARQKSAGESLAEEPELPDVV